MFSSECGWPFVVTAMPSTVPLPTPPGCWMRLVSVAGSLDEGPAGLNGL
jgi:hypothetical protein